MKQLIEHRLEVAEYNLENTPQSHQYSIITLKARIQELNDILKELERVEIKPQPIEELFEIKNTCHIWVKSTSNSIYFSTYFPEDKEDDYPTIILDVPKVMTGFEGIDTIKDNFTHFLIAEVPKF